MLSRFAARTDNGVCATRHVGSKIYWGFPTEPLSLSGRTVRKRNRLRRSDRYDPRHHTSEPAPTLTGQDFPRAGAFCFGEKTGQGAPKGIVLTALYRIEKIRLESGPLPPPEGNGFGGYTGSLGNRPLLVIQHIRFGNTDICPVNSAALYLNQTQYNHNGRRTNSTD